MASAVTSKEMKDYLLQAAEIRCISLPLNHSQLQIEHDVWVICNLLGALLARFASRVGF